MSLFYSSISNLAIYLDDSTRVYIDHCDFENNPVDIQGSCSYMYAKLNEWSSSCDCDSCDVVQVEEFDISDICSSNNHIWTWVMVGTGVIVLLAICVVIYKRRQKQAHAHALQEEYLIANVGEDEYVLEDDI